VSGRLEARTALFLDVARRVVDTMEEETAAIAAGGDPDGRHYADRKALLLFELTRAAHGVDPSTETLRPALTRLRESVERNHAAIGVRLEAARRVAETMKRVVAEIESDGAYDAAGLVRAARKEAAS
jgi:hypothetical protein